MMEAIEAGIMFVCCSCGRQHRLLPGVGAPYYWCNSGIVVLQSGDEIVVVMVLQPNLYQNMN